MSVSLINRSGFFAAKPLEAKNAALRPAPKPSTNVLSFPTLKPSAALSTVEQLKQKTEMEDAKKLAMSIAAIKMGLFSVSKPKMVPAPMPSKAPKQI